jgi:hypothetical protein
MFMFMLQEEEIKIIKQLKKSKFFNVKSCVKNVGKYEKTRT